AIGLVRRATRLSGWTSRWTGARVCHAEGQPDPIVLQRPKHDRLPGNDRQNDYNVLWRGRSIGRIWRHEYRNHPRSGLGPWHWYWQLERIGRETEGHALRRRWPISGRRGT